MKKRNIYQNQSQELLHLFEQAGSGDKVMCVPMDYAKHDHLVMFCTGFLMRLSLVIVFKGKLLSEEILQICSRCSAVQCAR